MVHFCFQIAVEVGRQTNSSIVACDVGQANVFGCSDLCLLFTTMFTSVSFSAGPLQLLPHPNRPLLFRGRPQRLQSPLATLPLQNRPSPELPRLPLVAGRQQCRPPKRLQPGKVGFGSRMHPHETPYYAFKCQSQLLSNQLLRLKIKHFAAK